MCPLWSGHCHLPNPLSGQYPASALSLAKPNPYFLKTAFFLLLCTFVHATFPVLYIRPFILPLYLPLIF